MPIYYGMFWRMKQTPPPVKTGHPHVDRKKQRRRKSGH